MRTLMVVVLLLAAGCGSDSSEPLQPPVEGLIVRDGGTLACIGASEACSPVGEPISCTCSWTCVSWQGVNHTSISFTYTRALPADPWPESYTYATGRPGTCN